MANLAGSDLLPEVDELFQAALLRAPPTEGGPHLAYALFLDFTGRAEEGAAYLQQAMDRHPRLGEVWFTRGRMRFQQQDGVGAREDLRKALECGLPAPLIRQAEEMLRILDGAPVR
jgi:tetratricopeptide (TPR) repeat protein